MRIFRHNRLQFQPRAAAKQPAKLSSICSHTVAKVLIRTLKNNCLTEQVKAMSFDTSVGNSVVYGSVSMLIEVKLY